ncbi:MAG: leucyl aminopeptidase [Deltaproteobacteria bacterium]|jgi:leucyl aminopeptidase|nr:leucyl aminopeptidase [Deltaproteobacteria bacterium]
MQFHVKEGQCESMKVDLIAMPYFEMTHRIKGKASLPRALRGIDSKMHGELSKQISSEDFKGEKNTSFLIFTAGLVEARYILLFGMGAAGDAELNSYREFAGNVASVAASIKAKSAAIHLGKENKDIISESKLRVISEGIILGSYDFKKYKTDDTSKVTRIEKVTYIYDKGDAKTDAAIDSGKIVAEAKCFARDLVNSPGSDLTPKVLASYAKRISAKGKLACSVWNMTKLKTEKMGGMIAVTKGSAEPPAFIKIVYKPKSRAKGHIVLVGKGITFDAGGISLKPPRGMEKMKNDMAGGAAVMGAMQAISYLKPNVEVTALIPAAENMPDGKALKPGDVIKIKNGKTVEIISTDAEGRLVLADALSIASKMKPNAIVDLATLTGGAVYCCGELYSLVVGSDQKLIDRLIKSSKHAGEPMWQLPFVEEYKKGYTSGIADLNNSGKSRAQTILGAIFLNEFVDEKIPWAHLDIAASAWTDEPLPTSPKGGTGVMVSTLVDFVMNWSRNL